MAQFPNQICINGASRGFVVDVGCKRFVFKDTEIDNFLSDLKLLMIGGNEKYEELRRIYCPEDFSEKLRKNLIQPTIGGNCPPPHPPVNEENTQCEVTPRY